MYLMEISLSLKILRYITHSSTFQSTINAKPTHKNYREGAQSHLKDHSLQFATHNESQTKL